MRFLGSLVGILVLLANLACASLCAAPQPVPPPCHQQHDEVKPCDQDSFAPEASLVFLAPMLTAEPSIWYMTIPTVAPASVSSWSAPSPPPIRRI